MTYDIFFIIVYFYFAQKFVQVHIKFNDRLIEFGILHHEKVFKSGARANFQINLKLELTHCNLLLAFFDTMYVIVR